jgi:lipoate-protein ligase A
MTDKQPWRLIRSAPLPGAMNMALDDALLQAVADGESLPVLRLYRWQPATLTLGYAQKVDAGVDLAACRAAGLDVVRRPTGGRAVLHAVEVTYAVIAKCAPPFGASVSTSYRLIAGILQATLKQLGLAAELVPGKGRGPQAKAVCFVAPAQHELLVAGCKVAGCAQKRRGGAFLQHGSLPLELDLDLLGKLLPGVPGEDRPDRLNGVGWLNRFAPQPLTIDTVETALIANFARELDVSLIESCPTPSESALAAELCERFYADPQWTLRGPGVTAAAPCGEVPA